MTYVNIKDFHWVNPSEYDDWSFTCVIVDTDFTEKITVQKEDSWLVAMPPLTTITHAPTGAPAIIKCYANRGLNVEGNLAIYFDRLCRTTGSKMDFCIDCCRQALPLWSKQIDEKKLKSYLLYL
jgi:hypothetical protein